MGIIMKERCLSSPSGGWMAVPNVGGTHFTAPPSGWDENVTYHVVSEQRRAERQSSSIATGRTVMTQPNLAANITSLFGPPSTPKRKLPSTSRPYRGKAQAPKKPRKPAKVIFVKPTRLPTMFTSNMVLCESLLDLANEDLEVATRHRLRDALATLPAYQSTRPEDLIFLSCTSKQLRQPAVAPGYTFSGERLRAMMGQGRLYVQVPGTVDLCEDENRQEQTLAITGDHAAGDLTDDDDDDLPDPGFINRRTPITTHSPLQQLPSPTHQGVPGMQTTALQAPSSQPIVQGSATTGVVFEDTGTPTVQFRRTSNMLEERSDAVASTSAGTSSCEHRLYSTYIDICVSASSDSEPDEDIRQAIMASLEDMRMQQPETETTLEAELTVLQSNLLEETSYFNVNRKKVWEGAKRGFLRKTYSPTNRISVKFTDDIGQSEGAADAGGPNREFFRLLMDHVRTSEVFKGDYASKMLCLNQKASTEDLYYLTGRVIAISLVHGGPGPRCFSSKLFELITCKDPSQVKFELTDIQEDDVKQSLQKIEDATSVDEMLGALDQANTILTVAGCSTATVLQSLQAGRQMVKAVVKFFAYDRIAAPLQRFKEGLSTLGVLDSMQHHPGVFLDLFCTMAQPLSAQQMEGIFRIQKLGPVGSNRRNKEEEVVGWWRDFLQDVEGKEVPHEISLEDVLMFTTGAKEVPSMGFYPAASLTFLHESVTCTKFPMANTCANEIRLPVSFCTYEEFRDNMAYGIANTQGFGML